jgi:hypothetical protein
MALQCSQKRHRQTGTAGRSATAGEGTPPPVTAVAVDSGTSVADVPGAAALGLVPVVCEMLKVSLLLGKPPARIVQLSPQDLANLACVLQRL